MEVEQSGKEQSDRNKILQNVLNEFQKEYEVESRLNLRNENRINTPAIDDKLGRARTAIDTLLEERHNLQRKLSMLSFALLHHKSAANVIDTRDVKLALWANNVFNTEKVQKIFQTAEHFLGREKLKILVLTLAKNGKREFILNNIDNLQEFISNMSNATKEEFQNNLIAFLQQQTSPIAQ